MLCLGQLIVCLQENEDALRQAIADDVGKPSVQAQVLEIMMVKNDACDLQTTYNNLLIVY